MKKVPVYFYYIAVLPTNANRNQLVLRFNDFLVDFRAALASNIAKPLILRKHEFVTEQKVVWLDVMNDLGNGNFDLVIKSAKYNHVRNVIDTQRMVDRGAIKQYVDGDEEKTHVCVRYNGRDSRLICLHESNYYGIAICRVISYLNRMLENYRVENEGHIQYILSKEDMPGDDFLEELNRMKRVSLLTLTVDSADMQDDFMRYAARDNVKHTVDITIGKVAKNVYIPKNLVVEYYRNHLETNIIKRIVADGKNQSGAIKLDTELIKMKQYLDVDTDDLTNEVQSVSFFMRAQGKIDELRGR